MRILMSRLNLTAPALMSFEAINALKDSGYYDGVRLEKAANSLPEYGIERVPFSGAGPGAEIPADLDITVHGAAYIALARTVDTTVYTADDTLVEDRDRERVQRVGWPHQDGRLTLALTVVLVINAFPGDRRIER